MKKKDDSTKRVPSRVLETYGGHYQRFESTFRQQSAGPFEKVEEKKGIKPGKKKRKKAG